MVRNLPSNAGDTGSILGRGIKIPYARGDSPRSTVTTEPMSSRAWAPQQEELPPEPETAWEPQQRAHAHTKRPNATKFKNKSLCPSYSPR